MTETSEQYLTFSSLTSQHQNTWYRVQPRKCFIQNLSLRDHRVGPITLTEGEYYTSMLQSLKMCVCVCVWGGGKGNPRAPPPLY